MRQRLPNDVETAEVSPAADDDDKYAKQRAMSGAVATMKANQKSTQAEFKSRSSVLVSLMIVQSVSGIILSRFDNLIKDHMIVTLFLTMLVGAGGNAGNQATVSIVQLLATQGGKITASDEVNIMSRELKLGFMLACLLGAVAGFRVLLTGGHYLEMTAISATAFFIVQISVVLGAGLPLTMARFGVDPAHAGPVIQVVMDIIGVTLTCLVCSAVLA